MQMKLWARPAVQESTCGALARVATLLGTYGVGFGCAIMSIVGAKRFA